MHMCNVHHYNCICITLTKNNANIMRLPSWTVIFSFFLYTCKYIYLYKSTQLNSVK